MYFKVMEDRVKILSRFRFFCKLNRIWWCFYRYQDFGLGDILKIYKNNFKLLYVIMMVDI